jgi:hypothetical protein
MKEASDSGKPHNAGALTHSKTDKDIEQQKRDKRNDSENGHNKKGNGSSTDNSVQVKKTAD